MNRITMIFERVKESKNYAVYKDQSGFNQLYLDKALPQQVVVIVTSKDATNA